MSMVVTNVKPLPVEEAGLLDPTEAGNRINEWRRRTRRSQAEMAKLLGVSTAAINRHESGNRGVSHAMIMKYARTFKLPTYALFIRPVPESKETNESDRENYAVGNRIRELRESMNLDRGELAKLTGISLPKLFQFEEGTWGMMHSEILKLARTFKIPTYLLYTRPFVLDPTSFDEDEYAENDREFDLAGEETDSGTPYSEYPGGPHGQVLTDTGL